MTAFKQTYLILSAQEYRIVDDNTGAVNEGISVVYLPSDNLDPTEDEVSRARGQMSKGLKYGKAALLSKLKPKMEVFPALYEVTLEMVMVQQKPQLRIADIDFIGTVKLAVDKPASKATA